jgi:hypothetical protein
MEMYDLFDRYLTSITPSESEVSRARTHRDTVVGRIDLDGFVETVNSGSYIKKIALRPLEDIDLFVGFDVRDYEPIAAEFERGPRSQRRPVSPPPRSGARSCPGSRLLDFQGRWVGARTRSASSTSSRSAIWYCSPPSSWRRAIAALPLRKADGAESPSPSAP